MVAQFPRLSSVSRRRFLYAAAVWPLLRTAHAVPKSGRVVIAGAGWGGLRAAAALRQYAPGLEVTLVDRSAHFTSFSGSNRWLVGHADAPPPLQRNYAELAAARGYRFLQGEIRALERAAQLLHTSAGALPYDWLVVAPGIEEDWRAWGVDDAASVARLETEASGAMRSAADLPRLRARLQDFKGGDLVLAIPPAPYRCPPAPYERASQIAHYLKQHKPNSKVIILDPKPSFTKQALFEQAWTELYGYKTDNALLEWWSGDAKAAGVVEVDVASKTAITQFGDRVQGAVLNVIPPQKAGKLAFDAGLVDATGWCPVNKLTFESTLHPKVHVIGDACMADSLPKSGFAANSEAKVCASAIHALLNGLDVESPSFSNGCYSLVGKDYAISVVGVYRLSDDGKLVESIAGSGGVSSATATAQDRLFDASYAYSWYNNFTPDVFR